MRVGDLIALADTAYVGAAGLGVGSAIRFLAAQDARVRGDTHNDVPMEPAMKGRLALALSTAVFRWPNEPSEDSGITELMWSLEFTRRGRAWIPRAAIILSPNPNPHDHDFRNASSESSDGGSRRLRRQSPVKQ
jgi:hypothetical protein